MTLSCCLNVRNESYGLRRCIESVRPWVDEVVIVDTGSVDGTQEIARELADVFEEWSGANDENGLPTDFSLIRNHTMGLASGEWYLWLDGHDVLVGGNALEDLASIEVGPVVYGMPYDYQVNENGRCVLRQLRERFMYPRDAFSWSWPIHELCIAREDVSVQAIQVDAPRVEHRPPPGYHSFDPCRNLRIAQAHVAKHGDSDPRMVYYLGLELKSDRKPSEAIKQLKRFVKLEPEGLGNEVFAAHLELRQLYSSMGETRKAVNWALRASQLRSWPDPFWAIGRAYFGAALAGEDPQLNWRRAAHHFELGLHIAQAGVGQSMLMHRPLERWEVERSLSVCYVAIGDIEGARASCLRGLEGLPGDPMLTSNLSRLDSLSGVGIDAVQTLLRG